MTKINSEFPIPSNDPRLLDSCLALMCGRGINVSFINATLNEKAKYISSHLPSKLKGQDIEKFISEAKQRILPISELDWFRDDPRACYLFWLTIFRSQFHPYPDPPVDVVPSSLPLDIEKKKLTPSYRELQLRGQPSSSKERFNEVVRFFDRIGQPLSWQRYLIAYLKKEWTQIFKARKPFPWLKEDDEKQIRWAWEYINKSLYTLDERPNSFDLVATGYEEMYLAIYAAYDAWKAHHSSKRLFLSDFNKAWQQKKHRDNRIGKKVCNLVLDQEVKKKLDALAALQEKSLSELVEELIEREYEINSKK